MAWHRIRDRCAQWVDWSIGGGVDESVEGLPGAPECSPTPDTVKERWSVCWNSPGCDHRRQLGWISWQDQRCRGGHALCAWADPDACTSPTRGKLIVISSVSSFTSIVLLRGLPRRRGASSVAAAAVPTHLGRASLQGFRWGPSGDAERQGENAVPGSLQIAGERPGVVERLPTRPLVEQCCTPARPLDPTSGVRVELRSTILQMPRYR